ncbi:diacylglycerol kinase delta-like isoform X2 [Lineus longissimus]
MLSGQHNWYACSHARPTYCNVCKEALSGVTSHGLSCEVCKFKAHKRCAVRAQNNCKWTTLAAVGKDIIEEEDGALAMPHQWLEGNLPVSAKCTFCDKTCGSVLRLQDQRCLWCRAMVHTSCVVTYPKTCPLGPCRVSVLPPICINNIDSDGYWEATRPLGTCPLLVFVNSKSGDNQGVKFLRRFKQLMNPAQVFDLMNGGPYTGIRLFQKFDPFRILVCGGDGSVGWVFQEMDKLKLHNQCQVGVLPLGTGNDLARVLGWGSVFDDETQIQIILEKMEHAQIKMLDRWSIMTYEGTMPPPRKLSQQFDPISVYEDSVAAHLSKILHSDDHSVVISSARVLCETVKDFVAKVGTAHERVDFDEEDEDDDNDEEDNSISRKCAVLNEKLDALLNTLNAESKASKKAEAKVQEEIKAVVKLLEPKPEKPKKEVDKNKESSKTLDPPKSLDLNGESSRDDVASSGLTPPKPTRRRSSTHSAFRAREALMSRANSLKKAIRQIIEHTERAVDEQNAQSLLPTIHSPCPGTPCPGTPMMNSPINEKKEYPEAGTSSGSKFLEVPQFSVFTSPGNSRPNSRSASPRLSPRLKRLGKEKEGSRSPRVGGAFRRISSMSTFRRSTSYQSGLSKGEKSPTTEQIPNMPILGGVPMFPLLPSISSMANSIAGGSFISKVLLANADALCAAASPLIEEDIALEDYTERCVMNNYFGIGLDAKIALDFHLKREEHPEKCSRTKNIMWYGMLGGKELLQKTFKNLDERVQLECDGQRIPLPSLQGIVVLNIVSYGGGTNFWGGTKEDDSFTAPSFDDKILEVVAVFGSIQMAMSRVMNLQHHRIAQCRSVKICIMGDEGVPVQVDGEAWIQPPGYMRIVHKNRAQVLTRDREFESTLKSWSEKLKFDRPTSLSSLYHINEDESTILQGFVDSSAALIKSVKVAAITHSSVEQDLFQLATHASGCLDRLYPSGRLAEAEGTDSEGHQPVVRNHVIELVQSVKMLHQETSAFLSEKAGNVRLRPDLEEKLSAALANIETDTKKMLDIPGFQVDEEYLTGGDTKRHKHGKFKIMTRLMFGKKEKDKYLLSPQQILCVNEWTPEDVAQWLEGLGLGEYKDAFIKNDIQGPELLHLERRDLKDMGIHKIGHVKRLQQAIKDITRQMSLLDKSAVAPL